MTKFQNLIRILTVLKTGMDWLVQPVQLGTKHQSNLGKPRTGTKTDSLTIPVIKTMLMLCEERINKIM